MTKITRINETKRGRFALFTEDEFLFSVDGETLALQNLCEGRELDDGELAAVREQSDLRKAKDQALRYLSLRAYAEKELYGKLCLKYDPHTAAAAIAAMVDLDLLDDAAYALEKARGMAQRGKSTMEIRRKLAMAGIQDDVAAEALAESDVDEDANALALVRKMYMEKLRRGEWQKVMAALARRGYAHTVAKKAVALAEQELKQDGETEWI